MLKTKASSRMTTQRGLKVKHISGNGNTEKKSPHHSLVLLFLTEVSNQQGMKQNPAKGASMT